MIVFCSFQPHDPNPGDDIAGNTSAIGYLGQGGPPHPRLSWSTVTMRETRYRTFPFSWAFTPEYITARVAAGELWQRIQGEGYRAAAQEHPAYPLFEAWQERRGKAALAVIRDRQPIAVLDFSADFAMATGERTRAGAEARASGIALRLGLRAETAVERLPGLAEAYRQAEAAGSSQQYDLYRDLEATLAKVDAGELGQAPRPVQELVQHLRAEHAAEQRAQERSHSLSL